MTIEEKSTELGISLAEIALTTYGVSKCKVNDVFHCFTLKAGEKQNIYILDDNEVKVQQGYFRWSNNTLVEGSTLAEVEVAFKAFIDGQEFLPVVNDSVIHEELS